MRCALDCAKAHATTKPPKVDAGSQFRPRHAMMMSTEIASRVDASRGSSDQFCAGIDTALPGALIRLRGSAWLVKEL